MIKQELARVVHEILDLRATMGWNIRSSQANKIVSAVIKAITNGLLRGEKVEVSGIGTFTVRTKPPTRKLLTYFYGRKSGPQILRDIPAKKYVHFQPCQSIVRSLNEA